MTLHRHALSVLALFVGGALLAPSRADALNIFVAKLDFQTTSEDLMSVGVTVDEPGDALASIELRVTSDAGDEDLVLIESDAWLHGSAALSALPVKDAAITLTLYDKGSASLMTFSGTLTTDGTVTLDEGESAGPCEILSKLGCTARVEYDVGFLAGETNADGKGYVLTLNLAGSDTYEVAYATVELSGGEKAEVDWDAVGSVWQADTTLEHTGVIDVKAKALDSEGNTLENVKAELAEPWGDDGEGVNALSAGSGTSVAIAQHYLTDRFSGGHVRTERMTAVSTGWTTTSYPTHAELELAGGETVTVPANSYQRLLEQPEPLVQDWDDEIDSFIVDPNPSSLVQSGSALYQIAPDRLRGSIPVCSAGTCVVLIASAEGYELSVTTYGDDPAKLPGKQDLGIAFYDKSGTELASETLSVEFDAEVTAVFAADLDIEGDPMGGDASGSVSLLGAANSKGKQATLSKGSFYGSFSRDTDGDLALGGYGVDDWATSGTSAGVLLGGPVECGGAGCDGDWAPPVILYGVGGKITKIVVSSGGLGYAVF